jgi:hypothetical protein
VSDVSLETPLDRLTTYITPNDDFFVRHHAPTEPPDPAAWSLTVDGEVGRPLRLSLEELKHSRSPARRTSQKVEISDDDGSTWKAADLDPRHDPYAWRLWSFQWTPRRAGRIRVRACATDSRGSVQPREAVWNPGGFLHNGWHSVEIDVTK